MSIGNLCLKAEKKKIRDTNRDEWYAEYGVYPEDDFMCDEHTLNELCK